MMSWDIVRVLGLALGGLPTDRLGAGQTLLICGALGIAGAPLALPIGGAIIVLYLIWNLRPLWALQPSTADRST